MEEASEVISKFSPSHRLLPCVDAETQPLDTLAGRSHCTGLLRSRIPRSDFLLTVISPATHRCKETTIKALCLLKGGEREKGQGRRSQPFFTGRKSTTHRLSDNDTTKQTSRFREDCDLDRGHTACSICPGILLIPSLPSLSSHGILGAKFRVGP